jgi:predicted membrane-bound spermidine synthase
VHRAIAALGRSGKACKRAHFHPAQRTLKEAEDIGLMLYTLALVLIILWLLGMVSSYTLGGFIHILLVVAVIVILVRLIQGRPVN